jgi:hypothetical protein
VIGDPPFEAGALHEIPRAPSRGVTELIVGASGAVRALTFAETLGVDEPAEFVAVTATE